MHIDFNNLWFAIWGVAIGTFALRFSFIYTIGRGQAPTWAQSFLRMVPASALAALVLPKLLYSQQVIMIAGNHRLWAGMIAAIVAARTRNVLLTIVTGMVSLWILNLTLGV